MSEIAPPLISKCIRKMYECFFLGSKIRILFFQHHGADYEVGFLKDGALGSSLGGYFGTDNCQDNKI